MAKSKTHQHHQANRQQKRQQQLIWFGGGAILLILLTSIALLIGRNNSQTVAFPDIHGMSFTGNGEQLRVATHTGLVAYQAGRWSKPDLPINDYMGYSGTEKGFFSSGHPEVANSPLGSPLGLVRSEDDGASLTSMNFSGESDFHVMGASYYGETVYVLNSHPNSLLSTGLYYSLDAGQTWHQSALIGLTANPIQVAVHPREAAIVAIASQNGLFLSNDFGMTFTRLDYAGSVTTVAFAPDGEELFFGFENLFSYHLASEQITALPSSPDINSKQAILYITINPASDELAIATSDRDIFYSPDKGQSWQQIGADGISRS